MKKLSKVLAFALAFAMTLSMGSFAATFVNSEFSDIDKAANPDAISQLAALDVMNGYTDGTIRPQGDITRAEIAKMIYVIKMGGKDDGAAYYKSVKTNLTDIEGHWAEGYIKYCYSTGIIAGRDDSKFHPDDNVTGVELAKMLLVVQGYNAQKSGLVGAGWANNVVELGAENEYFQGYNTLLNSAATREGAASIIVNALDATIVTWSDDAGDYIKSENNKDSVSIGSRYFDLHTYEGILLATGKYAINLDTNENTAGTEKDPKAAVGKISVNVVKEDDKATKDTASGTVTQFTFDEDATELLGQYVKVSVGKSGKVYGIYAITDKNTVVDTTVDKVVAIMNSSTGKFDSKIEIDGKAYKVDTKHTDVYVTGDGEPYSETLSDGKVHTGIGGNQGVSAGSLGYFQADETYDGSAVRFIDNDGDGRFDIALVNPILGVRKVTGTTTNSFSAGGSTVNYDDAVTSQKFSKGDWVVKTINFFEGKDQYDLATVVEGKVTSYAKEERSKLDGGAINSNIGAVKLDDGNWYTSVDETRVNELNKTAGLKALSLDTSGNTISGNSVIGGTRKLVTVGNIAYYNEVITSGASDIAFVAESGAAVSASVTKLTLMLADGSTSSITVDCELSDNAKATANKNDTTVGSWAKYVKDNGTDLDGDGTNDATAALFSEYMAKNFVGKLVSYEVNENGRYELTLMEDSTVQDAGYGSVAKIDEYSSAQNRVSSTTASYIVNNDATVFVQYQEDAGKNKYAVITGEELLDFSQKFGAKGYVLTEQNGVKSATVILLIGAAAENMPGSDTNKELAVITESPKDTTIGTSSSKYKEVTVWTLNGTKTLYIRGTDFGTLKRGSAFTYNLDATNSSYAIAKDIKPLDGPASIYYVNGSKSIALSPNGHIIPGADDALSDELLAIYNVAKEFKALYDAVKAPFTGTETAAQKLITDYNTAINNATGYTLTYEAQASDFDQTVFATGAKTVAGSFDKISDTVNTKIVTDYKAIETTSTAADVATVVTELEAKVADAANGFTKTYTLASDVKILNVETSTTKINGSEGDSISAAKEDENATPNTVDDKVYCLNACYLDSDSDGEIDYIVIDINGEWAFN